MAQCTLPPTLAALGLEREELGTVAVGEVAYEEKLVRVEEGHARPRIVWPIRIVGKLHADTHVAPLPLGLVAIDLDEHPAPHGPPNVDECSVIRPIGAGVDVWCVLKKEFDRHAASRDPAVCSIGMRTVAIPHRTVMDHQATVATSRAALQMVEVAAFVADDCRHTSLPKLHREFLSRARNEVNGLGQSDPRLSGC